MFTIAQAKSELKYFYYIIEPQGTWTDLLQCYYIALTTHPSYWLFPGNKTKRAMKSLTVSMRVNFFNTCNYNDVTSSD